MRKEELLASIRRDRALLDALVSSLSETQIVSSGLDTGWSVKDAVAHVSVWERRCAGWLEDVAHGTTPERPEVRDVDAANARDYATAKDLPWSTVLAESRASMQAVVRSIETLPEAELADEERFGWPTWQMASSNSDEHYREHIDQIQAWLAQQP